MDDVSDDQAHRRFLAGIEVGDVLGGSVVEVSRGIAVVLDGFPGRPLGYVGPLDLTWGARSDITIEVGQRITAEVTAVAHEEGRVLMSMSATEHPELWAFLSSLRPGEILSGTVAAIERFGVFVALDEGPGHPLFPGVGFITIPELSWRHIEAVEDVVRVGERVSCEFLQFDTTNGEARLSLRATVPDPFRTFADRVKAGEVLHGRVTHLAPFGAFVEVADGIEGLVHLTELAAAPVTAPEEVVQVGDALTVTVLEVDRERRRLTLSVPRVPPGAG